ncbi:dirigent protein 10-like [Diprion similis]|uniref:dirigent protein 10-like n=1 Tax=Diprion similis TaxID=362088 RepID=UPI001EF8D406|nr:dirigent protein 10-like [Diprion similis]
MRFFIAITALAAILATATAAPSGLWGAHGVTLGGPVLGPAALAGPIVGPARLSGPVDGGALVSGAVAGPAVVTGSVAGPAVVSGWGVPALGWGAAHGVAGVALPGAVSAPAVVAGPSGSIVVGAAGHAGIAQGWAGHW